MDDFQVESEVSRGGGVRVFADTNDNNISVYLHSQPMDGMDVLLIRAPEGLISTQQKEDGCGCRGGKEHEITIILKDCGRLVSMLRAVAMTAHRELSKPAGRSLEDVKRDTPLMSYVPSGRYYGGTIMPDDKLIPPGHPPGIPFDGNHLVIEIDWESDTYSWSLHGVGDDACWTCGGNALLEFRDDNLALVLMEPDGSGVSDLMPVHPVEPETAKFHLSKMMTELPQWHFEARLPASFRPGRTATEEVERPGWAR